MYTDRDRVIGLVCFIVNSMNNQISELEVLGVLSGPDAIKLRKEIKDNYWAWKERELNPKD